MCLALTYDFRISKIFKLCLATLFTMSVAGVSQTLLAQNKPFIVVIDPGHGGKDPGNLGNGFKEKDIVLDVSMQVGRLLEQQGVQVIYTRKKTYLLNFTIGHRSPTKPMQTFLYLYIVIRIILRPMVRGLS